MNANAPAPIIVADQVDKSFRKDDRIDRLVLGGLSLTVREHEIVALLGRSGSGKSTLLRMMAGLTRPSSGEITYRGSPITRPVQGLSMVFQNFALFPWLTVLQNVELGLEAQGVDKTTRRQRALQAIDIVGMDGFESAYPKELSGGMCQRVGFARALVVDPDVMLMDEPFSALDVLTAENLRGDLLDLWLAKKTNLKAIVIVTHNIEEAALLADRILIFNTDPGNIRAELMVDLPHPRNDQDPGFRQLVDDIYTHMTTRSKGRAATQTGFKTITLKDRLPQAHVSEMTGFIESLNAPEQDKRVDLPELSETLHLDVDDLFPITEALEILQFARVSAGDIELTPVGKLFAEADILERKRVFATQLTTHVPLAEHICQALQQKPGHALVEDKFLSTLNEYLSEEAAEDALKTVIDWGRYAELFAYDYNTRTLSLEDPN